MTNREMDSIMFCVNEWARQNDVKVYTNFDIDLYASDLRIFVQSGKKHSTIAVHREELLKDDSYKIIFDKLDKKLKDMRKEEEEDV